MIADKRDSGTAQIETNLTSVLNILQVNNYRMRG